MEDFNTNNLYKKSVKSVFALISRSFFLNILSYVASIVIFTYLRPSDVGIYVVIIAIQRIISFITDFGFGAALIQKKEEISEADIKTTFTLQIIITGTIFIFVISVQGLIAQYFSFNLVAMHLLLILVFTVFLSSFKVIPSILLERKINFHKLILPQIIESIFFNSILVLLVIKGYGLESYSWAFLISGLIGIPFYYIVSPWRPKIGIDKKSLNNLRYGIQFQAKNILATLKDDLLTLFLVKILSFNEIGFIGFGQRNAFFTYRYIVDSVTKVTFSTFSRLQENEKFLQKSIEKSLFYVSLAMFPFVFGIIIISPQLISFMPKWQNKWEPALLSLTFFSLNALVSSMSGILVNVLDATGRVKTTLKLMILWTILTWIFTWIGIFIFGYNGVAIASFIITLTIFITIRLVREKIQFRFYHSVYKPFLASLIMAMLTYLGTIFFVTNLLSLFLVIIVSVLIYGVCIFLLAKKEVLQVMNLINN
ncbi:MAG: oligosaccharide flippase family protein [Candidatus Levybacteria bacterium]|nr:oligosaccharide flippase family protein [Candidatus Levybacteria bacterium]MSU26120.1 polysaccharide biosynthesis protein [Candidatus Levybacteria bacterium]